MIAPAVTFVQVVVAIHIAAAVVAFGVTFAYPIVLTYGRRLDPRALPWFHRVQHRLGTRLITPGLLVVVVAGVYLASKEHQWGEFYVQWGLGVAIVLGALGGAFFAPREKKAAELAQRDVDAAGTGEVTFGSDYESLAKQVGAVGALASLLILTTVFIMELRL
ncbi:MAG: hypothetical protein QOK31_719 [Solirubrobacteraceae bacterium]|jgi:hypothetical protein|nr:hypothetical protein [Solirubrobacteraceae bacterium]